MTYLNIVSFVLLFIASVFSFFFIFGSGFAGSMNFMTFLIIGIFAAFWTVTYIWNVSFNDKQYKILFSISGTMIIYNILLSTLFVDPRAAQDGWIFIGTPVIMLVIWYFLIYFAVRKNAMIHWLVWLLFGGIILLYAWDVTSFYYTKVI